MAQNSKIEWTHHTANLWHGCTKVHEGCDNCYAETLAKRWGNDIWGNDKPRKEIKSVWNELLKMQKLAKQAGEIHRVFVGSMMDIFEKPMPVVDNKGVPLALINHPLVGFIGDTVSDDKTLTTKHLRDKLFLLISGGYFENLLFLFLTKRPGNINKYIPEDWKENPPKNVMFGTSVVDQATADKLIPQLLEVKGKRFLSVEPQLAEIRLHLPYLQDGKIHWVIQGGESGHKRRPFNTDWARLMRDDCAVHNVPYFFKQIDKVQPIPEDLMIREFPITNQ